MDPAALFRDNLPLIDRVLDRVCRRARLYGADAEDFASAARIALMDNDYAILRRYEGRSSLATFLAVVFEHMLADENVRKYGKWSASAEAVRFGPAGLLLDRLLHRERRDVREAVPIVQSSHPELTARDIELMAARLPERTRRPHAVALDAIEELPVEATESTDAQVRAADAQRLSDRAGSAVRAALAAMTLEDRALLRFRFVREMSIADIARVMRLPQRPLYRRLEALLARLRTALAAAGFGAADVGTIIAEAVRPPDFGLAEGKSEDDPPSIQKEPR